MVHTNKRKQEDYFYNVFLIVNGLLLVLILIHYYLIGYGVFHQFGLIHPQIEKLLMPVANSTLFNSPFISSLVILSASILGSVLVGVKKKMDINIKSAITTTLLGGGFFVLSLFILSLTIDPVVSFGLYLGISIFSLMLFNWGLGNILKYFKSDLKGDLFNKNQESFPQEERKITNNSSINLPTSYMLNKKKRKGWINIINPYRGLLVTGSPGSGKTYFVIRHIIEQLISKNFTMLVYDFKYPDLTKLTYNLLAKYYPKLSIKPTFYSINFDDPQRSHRVNPVDPEHPL
ncbi:hypothetical protein LCGC14_1823830 [marine sediment metagenome]|uniref:YWFCY domain-containing protein n=1 Tax=marine sediment metagenome TaxID=412755 RepID=A0A0F9JHL1_9ZZZZ